MQEIVEHPYSTPSILQLLPLLDHSISEVREGILQGFINSPQMIGGSVEAHFHAFLLEVLLKRIGEEKEPPILDLTLHLFARLVVNFLATERYNKLGLMIFIC